MPNYASHINLRATSQSEAANSAQVTNSAGGYTFQLDCFARLERFLILGCEGGTYYASEQKLTKENAKCVIEALDSNFEKAVALIANVSEGGRAAKNDAAIFALALAASHSNPAARHEALKALPRVCRIGTHLFQFVQSVKSMRGFGPALRKGIAGWYGNMSPEKLAYQIAKYQQRNGMSHRDVLRLCHAEAPSAEHQSIYRYAIGCNNEPRRVAPKKGVAGEGRYYPGVQAPPIFLQAFDELRTCSDAGQAIRLIETHGFTHEMVPSELKTNPEVWAALLPHMPLHALTRNLATLTRLGLVAPMSSATHSITERFSAEAIKKARLHPVAILGALKTYQQGHGEKSKHTWQPVREIVDCIDSAFYSAFETIEPSGARTLLAFDISGSMDGGVIAGMPGLTPRLASAAMGMVTARVEPNWHAVAFTAGQPGEHQIRYSNSPSPKSFWGTQRDVCGIFELSISPRQRLDSICQDMARLPMGATDCAAPMLYALGRKLEVDTFQIYTDNETWAGAIHPHQALEQYRREMGIAAKMVVVGMTATQFSIANPLDAGMLDCVGFDTNAPSLIADFSRPNSVDRHKGVG